MQRYKFFKDYQIFSETFFKKHVFIAPNHRFLLKNTKLLCLSTLFS